MCPKWPTRSAHPRFAAALDATTCAAQPSCRACRACQGILVKAEGTHRQDGAGRKCLHKGLQLCEAAVQRVGDLRMLLAQRPSLFASVSNCAEEPVLHANESHLDEQQPSTVKVRSCQAATPTGAAGITRLSCRRAGWRIWYGTGICRHECCLQIEVSRFMCMDAQALDKQGQRSAPDGRITSVGRCRLSSATARTVTCSSNRHACTCLQFKDQRPGASQRAHPVPGQRRQPRGGGVGGEEVQRQAQQTYGSQSRDGYANRLPRCRCHGSQQLLCSPSL